MEREITVAEDNSGLETKSGKWRLCVNLWLIYLSRFKFWLNINRKTENANFFIFLEYYSVLKTTGATYFSSNYLYFHYFLTLLTSGQMYCYSFQIENYYGK